MLLYEKIIEIFYAAKNFKRYHRIDQHLERHFTTLLLFYTTQIINPFLTLRLSANHDKGLGFEPIVKSLQSLMFL